jgi:NAD+ kinase
VKAIQNDNQVNIAVITNFNIPEKQEAASQVIDKLVCLGCKVVLPTRASDRLKIRESWDGSIEILPFDRLYKNLTAVIVLGGDGTILESARYAALNGVPVLGMNLGRLGYLAELEMAECDQLERVIRGDYYIEEHSMIKVSLLSEKKGKMHCGYALNDAVVTNVSSTKVIDLELIENETTVANYRADGLIVATPTGSTAYSMSAGGSVIDPRLKCICVTPICPHSFGSKPMVFPENVELEIKNCCPREKYLSLIVDGRKSFEVYYGDRVCVSKASTTAKFIRLKPRSFYLTLCRKMQNSIGG